jgi:hypothetical protein
MTISKSRAPKETTDFRHQAGAENKGKRPSRKENENTSELIPYVK